MGLAFSDMVDQLHRLHEQSPDTQKFVEIVIATNQDDGVVSYARGSLRYQPPPTGGAEESLFTPNYGAFSYLFSDRNRNIDVSTVPGGFGSFTAQPFSATSADSIGVRLRWSGVTAVTMAVTLFTWGNVVFELGLSPIDKLLYGVGAPVGNHAEHAVYLVSFLSVGFISGPPR